MTVPVGRDGAGPGDPLDDPPNPADATLGDISYQDGRAGTEDDPFLTVGGGKLGGESAFSGWIDELRLSRTRRYRARFKPFAPATVAFVSDVNTVGLYHFDEGAGVSVCDMCASPEHGLGC